MTETSAGFILCLSIISILSCGYTSQDNKESTVKEKTEKTVSSVAPRYERVETERYKELRKQIRKVQNKVKELEVKKSKLLAKYTEEHSEVKIVSEKLTTTKENLAQLENDLKEEAKKIEVRPENLPL